MEKRQHLLLAIEIVLLGLLADAALQGVTASTGKRAKAHVHTTPRPEIMKKGSGLHHAKPSTSLPKRTTPAPQLHGRRISGTKPVVNKSKVPNPKTKASFDITTTLIDIEPSSAPTQIQGRSMFGSIPNAHNSNQSDESEELISPDATDEINNLVLTTPRTQIEGEIPEPTTEASFDVSTTFTGIESTAAPVKFQGRSMFGFHPSAHKSSQLKKSEELISVETTDETNKIILTTAPSQTNGEEKLGEPGTEPAKEESAEFADTVSTPHIINLGENKITTPEERLQDKQILQAQTTAANSQSEEQSVKKTNGLALNSDEYHKNTLATEIQDGRTLDGQTETGINKVPDQTTEGSLDITSTLNGIESPSPPTKFQGRSMFGSIPNVFKSRHSEKSVELISINMTDETDKLTLTTPPALINGIEKLEGQGEADLNFTFKLDEYRTTTPLVTQAQGQLPLETEPKRQVSQGSNKLADISTTNLALNLEENKTPTTPIQDKRIFEGTTEADNTDKLTNTLALNWDKNQTTTPGIQIQGRRTFDSQTEAIDITTNLNGIESVAPPTKFQGRSMLGFKPNAYKTKHAEKFMSLEATEETNENILPKGVQTKGDDKITVDFDFKRDKDRVTNSLSQPQDENKSTTPSVQDEPLYQVHTEADKSLSEEYFVKWGTDLTIYLDEDYTTTPAAKMQGRRLMKPQTEAGNSDMTNKSKIPDPTTEAAFDTTSTVTEIESAPPPMKFQGRSMFGFKPNTVKSKQSEEKISPDAMDKFNKPIVTTLPTQIHEEEILAAQAGPDALLSTKQPDQMSLDFAFKLDDDRTTTRAVQMQGRRIFDVQTEAYPSKDHPDLTLRMSGDQSQDGSSPISKKHVDERNNDRITSLDENESCSLATLVEKNSVFEISSEEPICLFHFVY